MAQVSINIPVENIAGMINSMDVKEIETLCLLLNNEGQELLKRKKIKNIWLPKLQQFSFNTKHLSGSDPNN